MNDIENMDWEARYEALITPKTPFMYLIKTTGSLGMSDGLAWVANLYRVSPEGVPTHIGEVENRGDGGADMVWIMDPTHKAEWKASVEASFPDEQERGFYWVEEYATAYLAREEENYLMKAGK